MGIRTMARPNSPDMPPKRTKKVRLGIRIGLHEVLLPINHIYNKIRERKRRKHTGEGIDNSFICKIGKKEVIQV